MLKLPDREYPVRLRFAEPILGEARALADRLGWEEPATTGLNVPDPLVGAFVALLALLMIVLGVVGPSPVVFPFVSVLALITVVVGAVAFGRLL